jgi:hypothetical protein
MKRAIIFLQIITLTSYCSISTATESGLYINGTLTENKIMENQNFTATILVDKSPEEVFNAINNVRGWWSEQIEGRTDKLNEVFDYHYKDVHRCKIKITELVPGKKVAWLVLDNYFNFIKDQTEWKNTVISFEIFRDGNKTKMVFTHIGLVHAYECYDICSNAWGNYITGSLRNLIETGKGAPNPYIPAIKEAETLKKNNQ